MVYLPVSVFRVSGNVYMLQCAHLIVGIEQTRDGERSGSRGGPRSEWQRAVTFRASETSWAVRETGCCLKVTYARVKRMESAVVVGIN